MQQTFTTRFLIVVRQTFWGIVTVLFVAAILLTMLGCEQVQPTKDMDSGVRVWFFYVRDANSDRCLKVSGSNYTHFVTAPEAYCHGNNLPIPIVDAAK